MDLVEDVEVLEATHTAMARAWKDAQEGADDEIQSVRRIANSLARYLESHNVGGLPDLAREVAGAAEEDFPRRVPAFLEELERYLARLPRQTMRILVVDDDPAIVHVLEPILEGPGRHVRYVEALQPAREILREWPPDIVLLDLGLSDADGRDFLVELSEEPATASVPVVVLSAQTSPAVKTECFALGADKYVEKPVDSDLLAAAVSGSLRRKATITRLAQDDPLTGLPNRAAFRRIFFRIQSLVDRSRQPLSLALLDVDLLKDVNDRFGHPTGDRLLRELAVALQSALRDADVIGRWGGDEFVAIFPDTEPAGARKALVKAQEELQASGGAPRISFSAGLVQTKPHASLEETVAAADRSLYLAKSHGTGVIAVGNEAESPRARTVLVVEDEELDAALVTRLLERAGLESERVREGRAALERLRIRRPELVILDLRLPDMDGMDVLEEIRDDPSLRKVPVLILTAKRGEEPAVKGFQLGVDDYVAKPLAAGEFLARVRRLLRTSEPLAGKVSGDGRPGDQGQGSAGGGDRPGS